MLAAADLTATATLILAGITLALVLATVWLVVSDRAAAGQAREDARAERALVERQLESTYRPLLVDVLATGDIPPDMGATQSTMIDERGMSVFVGSRHVDIELPGMGTRSIDPRDVFVLFENGKVFMSVPLRNVGRGLAVIDGGGVNLTGAALGALEYRTIQRYHVPVSETTRIDLILSYRMEEPISPGEVWTLTVPYTDFAGAQRTVVTLEIVCRGDVPANGPWLIGRVAHVVDEGP